ncbi:hypothetical protein GEMRC1_006730 [Eukaryota sp. GEM-RC1]
MSFISIPQKQYNVHAIQEDGTVIPNPEPSFETILFEKLSRTDFSDLELLKGGALKIPPSSGQSQPQLFAYLRSLEEAISAARSQAFLLSELLNLVHNGFISPSQISPAIKYQDPSTETSQLLNLFITRRKVLSDGGILVDEKSKETLESIEISARNFEKASFFRKLNYDFSVVKKSPQLVFRLGSCSKTVDLNVLNIENDQYLTEFLKGFGFEFATNFTVNYFGKTLENLKFVTDDFCLFFNPDYTGFEVTSPFSNLSSLEFASKLSTLFIQYSIKTYLKTRHATFSSQSDLIDPFSLFVILFEVLYTNSNVYRL